MLKLVYKVMMFSFISSFFSGCSSLNSTPDYVKIAEQVTARTVKKLRDQKGLHLSAVGGIMIDDIQQLSMAFEYYQEVDIKSARDLIVYAVSEYLSAINSDEKIRPYLAEYPFIVDDVKIIITIYNPDRSCKSSDKIYLIECIDGLIAYFNGFDIHHPILQEGYEQALKLISNQASS